MPVFHRVVVNSVWDVLSVYGTKGAWEVMGFLKTSYHLFTLNGALIVVRSECFLARASLQPPTLTAHSTAQKSEGVM